MLGNAASLVLGDGGFADAVQQRGFAVVNMPHESHHRRTGRHIFRKVLLGFVRLRCRHRMRFGFTLVFKGETVFFRHLLRSLDVQLFVDGRQNVHQHQFGNQLVGLHAEQTGEIPDHDRSAHRHHAAAGSRRGRRQRGPRGNSPFGRRPLGGRRCFLRRALRRSRGFCRRRSGSLWRRGRGRRGRRSFLGGTEFLHHLIRKGAHVILDVHISRAQLLQQFLAGGLQFPG